MIPIAFEKTFPTATFEELWKSRLPDFRAKNEIRNLKRKEIAVEIVKKDADFITLRAFADSVPQINYLFKRGYEKAKLPEPKKKKYSDVVKTILARPRNGSGGGIPLTRGEVAMLFLDGYAGDHPNLLDIRSQGYGEEDQWDGLDTDCVFEDEDTIFIWSKWEPLEHWPSDDV